jgi:hypothetical protein
MTAALYGDGSVVLGTQDTGYETMALIPFEIDAMYAQHQTQDLMERRIAAPMIWKTSSQRHGLPNCMHRSGPLIAKMP